MVVLQQTSFKPNTTTQNPTAKFEQPSNQMAKDVNLKKTLSLQMTKAMQ